jgi:hypothetical protein
MSDLIRIITADAPEIRDSSLDAFCQTASLATLLEECAALDSYRRSCTNLYQRVRALFFLYAIHRYHLPAKPGFATRGLIPFSGYEHLLKRRFEEAAETFLGRQASDGANDSISSALAAAYRSLGFQTLADQVRASVRSVRGNQWMFRTGHPADQPLRIRPELLERENSQALFPILREGTPVRMDLTHSGWSDIFFLGMDFPEGARVLNISIDLSVQGAAGSTSPRPPVEAYLRVIDRPVLRLTSVDLGASVEITAFAEVFDFAADYLGLLKAAVIASGIVPPGMEGAEQPLSDLLGRIVGPGRGIEIVSYVRGIPKGSRLAVSTTLLASIITVSMRATGQTRSLTGALTESERRLVAARAILGEWLGGSGGGWQDSGGIWPGIKLIAGARASSGDAEFGRSRGCLLPTHKVFSSDEVSPETRQKLQDSLVLVHGGMAQDVGPILEMVTEKYLLRSENEWQGRKQAIEILDEVVRELKRGDLHAIGTATHKNFTGPIQTIIPWACNLYTESLIQKVSQEFGEGFWGFWMLGGMSGGGMGFLFNPTVKPRAHTRLQSILGETKRELEHGVPFAMEPVVYDFAVNETGTWCEILTGDTAFMPEGYYTLTIPGLLRTEPRKLSSFQRVELNRFGAAVRGDPALAGVVQKLFDRILPSDSPKEREGESLRDLLSRYGFDRVQHEQIRADLRSGRIGMAQNRLPVNSTIEDVGVGDVLDSTRALSEAHRHIGSEALRSGSLAVVTLAGGAGTRWTKGAGTVKALHPFCRLDGKYRSFIEVHLAKCRKTSRAYSMPIPHIVSTSYVTHEPIRTYLERHGNHAYPGPVFLSPGSVIGLRFIPMAHDLRFLWEEMPQQLLDEQAQKVVESLHTSLVEWAVQSGEANDYTDNVPMQCLHPVGHWYEIPNLLRNGTLQQLLHERPALRYLMMHNIDTLGANIDPAILGYHIESGAALTTEVTSRRIIDRGGGLARIDGKLRLVEGMALPKDEMEFRLSYYNSATYWIDIDRLLRVLGLSRADLEDGEKVTMAVRSLALRMPTYITIKDVKKRWGKGHEDIYPTTQYEKLWGDMTALSELECRYVAVPRFRGQQLKEPAQLDGWLRDGSAAHVKALCEWQED